MLIFDKINIKIAYKLTNNGEKIENRLKLLIWIIVFWSEIQYICFYWYKCKFYVYFRQDLILLNLFVYKNTK
jgi:hypothetical protein